MSKTYSPFSCTHSANIPELMNALGCSLMISTYQAGRVIVISPDIKEDSLFQLPRFFDTPMGIALEGNKLAVACREEVVVFSNTPSLAPSYPAKLNVYDGMFVPQAKYFSGRLSLHDIAWCRQGLIAVNTAFSCLCMIDDNYSFSPIWKPPFITELAAEDRCHLNGMAVLEGQPKYVTMFGNSDSPRGWDENKQEGGILMDIENEEVILDGLPMPHTPRLINGDLYLLLSATGELVKVDVEEKKYELVKKLPGFVRGMSYYEDHLFIGLSRIRKKHIFGGLPITDNEVFSGIMVLHLPSSAIVGEIKYLTSCEEIYDVQVLPELSRPNILGIKDNKYRAALTLPNTSFWGTFDDA